MNRSLLNKSMYVIMAISAVSIGYVVGTGAGASNPRATTPPVFVGSPIAGLTVSNKLPAASTEQFMSVAQMSVQPGCVGPSIPVALSGEVTVHLSGPTLISRKAGEHTQLIGLDLTGYNPTLGVVNVALMPGVASTGEIVSNSALTAFTITSFFDVFTDISIGGGQFGSLRLSNAKPLVLGDGSVQTIPPIGAAYQLMVPPVVFTSGAGGPTACVTKAIDAPSTAAEGLLSEQLTQNLEISKGVNPAG
jgi:hypothetical protein